MVVYIVHGIITDNKEIDYGYIDDYVTGVFTDKDKLKEYLDRMNIDVSFDYWFEKYISDYLISKWECNEGIVDCGNRTVIF